jgi:hypothetical protein
MNRKFFFISLAPLLAIAALAVMPAASQAAPHIYVNGVIAKEAKKVREISWGTAKLKNSTLGEVECHNIFAGYGENPTGGGAAIGKVQAFYPYECGSSSCEALGGVNIEVTAGKLPWKVEVTEPESKVFRQKTGFKGKEKNKPPTEPEYVNFTVNCERVAKVEFFGEQTPKILNNGLSIGSAPGELELTNGGELESELIGNGTTEGNVKVEGYGAEELIEVKNP